MYIKDMKRFLYIIINYNDDGSFIKSKSQLVTREEVREIIDKFINEYLKGEMAFADFFGRIEKLGYVRYSHTLYYANYIVDLSKDIETYNYRVNDIITYNKTLVERKEKLKDF